VEALLKGVNMINEATIEAVWDKTGTMEGFDARMYRRDACGALIMRDKYGKVNPFGWEIDHIYPQNRGGDDNIDNLRALHYMNNRSKRDDYPSYTATVTFDGKQNVEKMRNLTVNEKVRRRIEELYKG
jgi:hypothetical protein